ncbi:hypothetical protein AB0I77_15925 [Streptomyces sp. NPDC050619]|uniref:hypothetical protein n=1 Tax=Streptomyces sp. NPDC050619 TaxID=3157214 RepID=UPI00341FD346
MTSTTRATRTADTDVSALLIEARRELDSIANRGIVSAPRAVADALITLKELAPTLIPHARTLAAGLGDGERSELHELIKRTEARSNSRPRADLAYEHLLVLVSQLQELLRWLERAHGISCRRTQATAARRRSNQDSIRPQM